MCSIVTGVKQEELQDAVESADSGNWKSGYVRLFLSRSALHKEFIGKAADELTGPFEVSCREGLRGLHDHRLSR
jgi:hypothetical protein